MRKPTDLMVQVFALLFVAGAGLVVYRLAYSDTTDPMAPLAASAASNKSQGAADLVTYRFLYPNERGAGAGRLTLARFVDDSPIPSRTWKSQSIEHWRSWAPGIFVREMQWAAEDQPGWQISRWLCTDEPAEHDRNYVFWSIQALRFLDPEDTAHMIDMIEKSGKMPRIYLTEDSSRYDYARDTLYWNPTGRSPGAESTTEHPLASLAYQLSQMCHDLCDDGDCADDEERQRIALAAERRVRHILSRKDPTSSSSPPASVR